MRRLQQILTAEPTFTDLLRRQQRAAAVRSSLQRMLPTALAAQVSVTNPEPPELELTAANGAAAAITRQHLPGLLQKLTAEGWEFTGIRVRVQARLAPRPEPKSVKKHLDSASATTLGALAEQIGDGALAQALRRLAGQGQRRELDESDNALQRDEDQNSQQ